MLTIDKPQSVGLDPHRWQLVLDLAKQWCDRDEIPSIGLVVGRSGKTTGVHLFGRQRTAPDSPPIRDNALFLIASITKPVVAMAALILIERGQLSLGDRVRDIVPEFAGKGRYGITVHHLLTHTSGLPDMPTNNRELRMAHVPFSRFVEETCKIEPAFVPGRGVSYQSMGFAMLGEIITRTTGMPYAEFVRREILVPLGMRDSALGAPDEWFAGPHPIAARITEIRPENPAVGHEDWGWNSRYWRHFGAPWGGLLATPGDLANFAQMMLNRGRVGDSQIVSPASVAAATRNQLETMPHMPEEDRRCRPWGLGWRLNWPAYTPNFGNLLGPRMYGHWGSTGTVLWIDPDLDAFAIILTTQPQEPLGRHLARLSNTIVAAMV